mmetsp:Transcript_2334/g.5169  ORF Transcript_2334/g.5169 Transcript_2334/m.5169 type:complete len:179 (-) Transcript_2334:46-582(-)
MRWALLAVPVVAYLRSSPSPAPPAAKEAAEPEAEVAEAVVASAPSPSPPPVEKAAEAAAEATEPKDQGAAAVDKSAADAEAHLASTAGEAKVAIHGAAKEAVTAVVAEAVKDMRQQILEEQLKSKQQIDHMMEQAGASMHWSKAGPELQHNVDEFVNHMGNSLTKLADAIKPPEPKEA